MRKVLVTPTLHSSDLMYSCIHGFCLEFLTLGGVEERVVWNNVLHVFGH